MSRICIAVFDVDYVKLRKMIRFSQFYSIIKVTIVAVLVCPPALLNSSNVSRRAPRLCGRILRYCGLADICFTATREGEKGCV